MRAKNIPIILRILSFSLYTSTAKIIGITTDIFPATEATERPFFWEVIASILKMVINKKPKKKDPASHGLCLTISIDTIPEKEKSPQIQATI